MPADESALTLSLILTAGGAVAASALVTGIVQILKQLGNFLDGKERLAAFILSAVLVVVAFVAGVNDGTLTLNVASLFAAFLAWYGIARLSMAVYADVVREPNSLTGSKV
jgi:uncharacterized membrane protein HdeD (DUF308 family)